jgi:hypothetical protein
MTVNGQVFPVMDLLKSGDFIEVAEMLRMISQYGNFVGLRIKLTEEEEEAYRNAFEGHAKMGLRYTFETAMKKAGMRSAFELRREPDGSILVLATAPTDPRTSPGAASVPLW